MLNENFQKALIYTGQNEGGFSDVKEDRGGPTKFGITIHELARWRRAPVSKKDVKDLTRGEANQIFKAWYWDVMSLDLVKHAGVAVAMYDIGVVRGVSIPPKYAQVICNKLDFNLVVDGFIGPKTLAAINDVGAQFFIQHFAAMNELAFNQIADQTGQDKFRKGWVNRAQRLLTLINLI